MDISFAVQALAVEELVTAGGALGPGVHAGAGRDRPRGRAAQARVARRRDRRARPEQEQYLRGWAAELGRLARMDGLQASVEKMRAARVSPTPRSTTFRTTTSSSPRARPGMLPGVRDRAASRTSVARRAAGPATTRRSIEAVVLKLNGGLGTSMGMTRAKSLLEVKDGLTLPRRDRAPGARRCARRTRRAAAARAHELFYTQDDSLAALARTPGSASDVPADFVQHKEPKIARRRAARRPSGRPTRSLEWCPPGHGDLYTALLTSGMLDDAARAAATATRSCRTPTTSAPCSTRASSPGSRARRSRS